MRIYHVSFHSGCISDIAYVLEHLGHEVTSHMMIPPNPPYQISAHIADQLWEQLKDTIQSYDIVLTSDTVALAYPFLRHLAEMKPHLIILNCNRFTYGMEYESNFMDLLQRVQQKQSHVDKVTYIPYTSFERIWCGKHKVFLYENEITPIGRYINHFNVPERIQMAFGAKQTDKQSKPDAETFFVQTYGNHMNFVNLPKELAARGISVVYGGYTQISQLDAYKAAIVLPDQFSKYFTFESIQSEIVVIMPSPKFLMELVNMPGYYFNIEGSSGRLTYDYVNLCEWYKYPECRIYFESFAELYDILRNLDEDTLSKHKKWMRHYRDAIHDENILKWKNILSKIVIKQEMHV